jgi:hypothetical protein
LLTIHFSLAPLLPISYLGTLPLASYFYSLRSDVYTHNLLLATPIDLTFPTWPAHLLG